MVIKYRLQPYLEGANNAVKFLGISKGNEVLLVTTAKIDRDAIEAVAYAVRGVGAHVSILEVEEPPPNQPFPRVCLEAARGVDYYISMGGRITHHHFDGFILTYDYGVSNVTIVGEHLGTDASRYPLEVWYELTRRVKWRIGHADPEGRHLVHFRIVDGRGSDLHMQVMYPEDIGAYIGPEPLVCGPATEPPRVCSRGGFPPGSCPWGDLGHSATGDLVTDAVLPFGWLKHPLKFTFRNGFVSDVKGAPEAEKLKDLWKPYPNANRLREIGLGTNPHTPLDFTKPFGSWTTRRAGTLFFGTGGDTSVGGTDYSSEYLSTTFALVLEPTVYADDEIIIDNGKLTVLDDPELWELAKKYGDPAKLLTTI